jgi:hypothetical protein
MKKLILSFLSLIIAVSAFSQKTNSELQTQITNEIKKKTLSPERVGVMFDQVNYAKENVKLYVASGTNTYLINEGLGAGNGIIEYQDLKIAVRFTNAPSGASTLNINSIGPITINDAESTIEAGKVYWLAYNGSSFDFIGGGGTGVASVTGQGVDNTDPANPVISGLVETVTGDGVDNTDPANPVMSFSSLTASNGITRTGSNFALGGTMTGNVSINSNTANTNTFTIGGTTRPNRIQFLAGNVGTNSGTITVDDTSTSLSRTIGNPMSIVLSSLGMTVTDLIGNKGLVYAADYSTNFAADPRGIPDVAWVNTQTANAWPLTGTRSFTGNATIAGGGFNATIGQSGDRMGNFRVWSNGAVGLDGATSSFIQSDNSTFTASPNQAAINTGGGNLTINDTDFKVTDTRATPRGLAANADYSANYQALDYVSKLYTDAADALKTSLAWADNEQTTSYTGVIGDVNKVIQMNSASALNFTVPPNSSVAYPIGTYLIVRQKGAGTVTIVEGAGVTVTEPAGGNMDTPGQGLSVTLHKTGADTWDLENGSAGGGGGSGTVTTVTGSAPIVITSTPTTTPNVTISDATTSSKGASSYTAADFDVTAGNVAIDYTNGQSASGSTKGFVSSSDYVKFRDKPITLSCSDLLTALTTGTNKAFYYVSAAFTVTSVRAMILTAQSSGTIVTIDINENGTTILSTKLTIDNSENRSETAATPVVISDTAISSGSLITIDFDAVGTGGAGVIVEISGHY